ncbi:MULTISPECIES: polyhydroxyalkanoic acid system family protein [Stutzerimonas]|uniref:Polyhydroxyalkanoic acid system protein n=2 Tax=Stutzerimonas xanthomarina TaxID=271420 RepID=A0ABY0ZNL3_9GAMM|nr:MULTISPECIES: polyhydroxyalkanoic acid system family protein [Stutzerimonas]MCP9340048.1 polyhydroxyalkanoic acid system family protein [Stutzerimonas xanthomarina]SEH56757.1 putative polyhydroxyalkanoic acid system protein [Stutzerimonas xanthomarina]SHH52708.1 putative polyhydroxyalkanoic acid system protein [Stutzerimonas xanthomarina DSM 18231]
MARIIVERNHSLGRDAAREKAEQLAAKLERDFGVRCEWKGDVLEVRRSGADGRIEVEEDRVRVLLNLGLLMSAMGASVQAQIERALDKALAA